MRNESIGYLKSLLTGNDPDALLTVKRNTVQASLEGLEGDKHSGFTRASDSRTPFYERGTLIRNDRQISIVSSEELALIAGRLGLPEILPEWLGANLEIVGIPNLTLLPPTTRIFFPQEAVLTVTAENHPCKGPGRILQQQYVHEPDLVARFVQAAQHLRGVVAVVERAGVITVDDELRVVPALFHSPIQPAP